MTKKIKNLGEFEILVLAALMRLGEDAYGVSIRQEIEECTSRVVTVGALYATLTRLEEKSYITARKGEATPERGGRAKQYYEMTASGRSQLERSISALNNMFEGVKSWHEIPTS